MKDQIRRSLLLLVIILTICCNFWMLSIQNTYCYDDTTNLKNASLASYSELYTFFPNSVYLDRPIRDIATKLLYDLVGKDFVQAHILLMFVHIINVVLIYEIATLLFGLCMMIPEKKVFWGALIAAAVFGICPTANMAVAWVSAINDSVGTLFGLASLFFYLKILEDRSSAYYNGFISVVMYFLSIRTKEMFYPLPLIMCLFEFLYNKNIGVKKNKIHPIIVVNSAIMILFSSNIIFLKMFTSNVTTSLESPYYQTFNPMKLIINLFKYCSMMFDIENGGYTYLPSTSGTFGAIVLIGGFIYAIYISVKRREFNYLVCYFSIGLSIGMVLPMINMTHRLYLYFPSAFVGILFALAIMQICGNTSIYALMFIAILCLSNRSKGNVQFINSWFSNCKMENKAWNDIEAIEKPISGTHFYVYVEDINTYNPFFYGPGSVINLIYQDNSFETTICTKEDEINYIEPYVIWENIGGNVTEVCRSNMQLSITSMYPDVIDGQTINDNESVAIGIVPSYFQNIDYALVNGNRKELTIGEGFVSTLVDKTDVNGLEKVEVILVDSFGNMSEPVYIEIQ